MKPPYLLAVARYLRHLNPGFKLDQSHPDSLTLITPSGKVILKEFGKLLHLEIDPALARMENSIRARIVSIDESLPRSDEIDAPCSVFFAAKDSAPGPRGTWLMTFKPIFTPNSPPDLYKNG